MKSLNKGNWIGMMSRIMVIAIALIALNCGPTADEPTLSNVRYDIVGKRLVYGSNGLWVFHQSDEYRSIEIVDTLRGNQNLAHIVDMEVQDKKSQKMYYIRIMAVYSFNGGKYKLKDVLSNTMKLVSG